MFLPLSNIQQYWFSLFIRKWSFFLMKKTKKRTSIHILENNWWKINWNTHSQHFQNIGMIQMTILLLNYLCLLFVCLIDWFTPLSLLLLKTHRLFLVDMFQNDKISSQRISFLSKLLSKLVHKIPFQLRNPTWSQISLQLQFLQLLIFLFVCVFFFVFVWLSVVLIVCLFILFCLFYQSFSANHHLQSLVKGDNQSFQISKFVVAIEYLCLKSHNGREAEHRQKCK